MPCMVGHGSNLVAHHSDTNVHLLQGTTEENEVPLERSPRVLWVQCILSMGQYLEGLTRKAHNHSWFVHIPDIVMTHTRLLTGSL